MQILNRFRVEFERAVGRELSVEMTVVAGSRLDPYEILSPLGAGGMGAVSCGDHLGPE